MYCPQTILSNNKIIFLMINTKGDYNYKRQIELYEWINFRRYEIILFPKSKYRIEFKGSLAE